MLFSVFRRFCRHSVQMHTRVHTNTNTHTHGECKRYQKKGIHTQHQHIQLFRILQCSCGWLAGLLYAAHIQNWLLLWFSHSCRFQQKPSIHNRTHVALTNANANVYAFLVHYYGQNKSIDDVRSPNRDSLAWYRRLSAWRSACIELSFGWLACVRVRLCATPYRKWHESFIHIIVVRLHLLSPHRMHVYSVPLWIPLWMIRRTSVMRPHKKGFKRFIK